MFDMIISALSKKSGLNSTKNNKENTYEEVAQLLKVNKEALNAFEKAYIQASSQNGLSDNLFKNNAKQMAELRRETSDISSETDNIIHRIVQELLAQTEVFSYEPQENRTVIYDFTKTLTDGSWVTKDELNNIPVDKRPQLSGNYMKIDVPDSGITLATLWNTYLRTTDPIMRKNIYNSFRQGLDLLDVDNLTYAIIDTNPNSMGNWLPFIIPAVEKENFFKIPATKIIKLPLSLLQLTRLDYMSLTRTTLDIVNEYCYNAFGLDVAKDYFVKTGTYSSKYDFRNARVNGEKEVKELGEYLLFIHWQALQMAHYDLSGRKQPVIYGVSTTTEWVVREFIPDKEENPTIYHGLPLRTEYRAFVDFDTDKVISIHPYWDPDVMEKHFANKMNSDIDARHDYITYMANKEKLMSQYDKNKSLVIEHLEQILPEINLQGQWSVDILQNGEEFYIIDMAIAENSAFYDSVPVELRNPRKEDWIPKLNNFRISEQ